MQTFLPYPDFVACAKVLDGKRLGKQRVECKQIFLNQFPNHPATVMWRDFKPALVKYALIICREWTRRGNNDTLTEWFLSRASDVGDYVSPPWLGDDRLHSSHRSQLLAKWQVYYSHWGWKEEPGLIPYFWPSKHMDYSNV